MKLKKNTILIFAGLALVAVFYLFTRKGKGVGLESYKPSESNEADKNKLFLQLTNLNQPNYSLISNFVEGSFSATGFPKINIQAPITKPTNEKQIRVQQAQSLIQRYDKQVSSSASETGVPRFMHYAIMLLENPEGIASLDKGFGVGLGQITVVTPTDSIRKAKSKGRLTETQIDVIKRNASKANPILAKTALGEVLINKADLKKAELNIHLIGITLQNLFYEFGVENIHQVVFAYNRGISVKQFISARNLKNADAKTLYEKAKGVPYFDVGSDYIINLLGQNGMFDIVCNSLGIKD